MIGNTEREKLTFLIYVLLDFSAGLLVFLETITMKSSRFVFYHEPF